MWWAVEAGTEVSAVDQKTQIEYSESYWPDQRQQKEELHVGAVGKEIQEEGESRPRRKEEAAPSMLTQNAGKLNHESPEPSIAVFPINSTSIPEISLAPIQLPKVKEDLIVHQSHRFPPTYRRPGSGEGRKRGKN